MGVPVVEITDVSKRFVIRKEKSLKERLLNFGRSNLHKEDFWALKDVSLTIDSGTTVGLLGPNGSGKSTLLKTIGGIIQPTSGSVRLRGRLAALLELGAGFHPDLTGRENVYLNAALLGLTREQTDKHFDAIVDFSGIEPFIDTQVKFYSSGMYVRLAFSVAVHVDPDLLLVDEVLAVGDEPFQRKCMDRIREFQTEGRTIALVSHSAEAVGELCDRAVVLQHGRVHTDGPTEVGIRALRDAFEEERRAQEDRAPAAKEAETHARARIVSAEVLDVAGLPVQVAPTGSELCFRVGVDLLEELPGWSLAMAIETPLGQYLWGTNSQRLGVSLPSGPGLRTFEFRMSDNPLGAGQYVLRVRASGPTGELLDLVPQAAQFSIEVPTTTSTGVLTAPVSLAVLD